MSRIFISYRRDDTEMVAGRLAKDLRSYFGEESVFRDKESIPVGADWAQEIKHAIGPGGVVLVLIGEDWLEGKPKGQRRLDDAQDPHRNEIGAALHLGVTVLPLLVRNMKMPPKEELPDALQRLPALNAMKLRDDEWEGFDFPRLAKVLEKAGFKPKLTPGPAGPAPIIDSKKPTSAKSIWALVLGVIGLGAGSASSQSDAGFALFIALMASLLAFFGFRDARAGRVKGERLAIGGMVAGGVATLLALMALGRTSGEQPIGMAPAMNLVPANVAPAQVPATVAPALPQPAPSNVASVPAVPAAVSALTDPAPVAVAPASKPRTAKPQHRPQAQVLTETADDAAPAVASTQEARQVERNLSGLWVDSNDGTHIQIQQDGAAVVAAILQDGGQVGGIGSVNGRQVEIVWGAAGVPVMTSTLKLSANGNELRGPSVAINGQSETTILHRQ